MIDALIDGDISPRLEAEIKDWLGGEANLPGKLKALETIYKESVHADPNPDPVVYDFYCRLAERLGFPQAVIPYQKRKWRLQARWILGRVAAVLLPLLFVAGAVYFYTGNQEQPIGENGERIEYTASNHSVKYIKLPDGSQVWLKSGVLSCPEDLSTERNIRLEGEAFFSVARDESHPFRVETDGLTVTVLGTEFQVNAHTGAPRVEVAVSSGKVQVDAAGASTPRILEHCDRLTYHRESGNIVQDLLEESHLTEIKAVQLHFDYVKLEDAFESIARYYGVDIVVNGAIPEHEALRVKFDGKDELNDVLFIIRQATMELFDYTISRDTVQVTARDAN